MEKKAENARAAPVALRAAGRCEVMRERYFGQALECIRGRQEERERH